MKTPAVSDSSTEVTTLRSVLHATRIGAFSDGCLSVGGVEDRQNNHMIMLLDFGNTK